MDSPLRIRFITLVAPREISKSVILVCKAMAKNYFGIGLFGFASAYLDAVLKALNVMVMLVEVIARM